MDALTAAVVLAWAVIVVLGFAMAGLLHQLRALQATISREHVAGSRAGSDSSSRSMPVSVLPAGGQRLSAILLADDDCVICHEVAPAFAALAYARSAAFDSVILTYTDSETFAALRGVRFVSDSSAYHMLNPGWRPALIIITANGNQLAAEPAGSEEAIRTLLDRAQVNSTVRE